MLKDIDPREDREPKDRKATPNEITVDIPIDEADSTKVLKISSQLDPVRAKELADFLRENLYCLPALTLTCVEFRLPS